MAIADVIDGSTMTSTPAVRRIIFIDPTVPDLQTLLDGMGPDAIAVVLQPGKDGVQQIADYLVANELSDLSAIQIVSHGSEGSIRLGSIVLDNSNVVNYADALAQIGAAVAPDGDIMLYGCDVADDTTGQQFIAALASLTGADVAASTDPTGAAALGGDWILESATGPIEAAPAFTAEAESNFNGLLTILLKNEIISVSSDEVQGGAASVTGSGTGNPPSPTDSNNIITSLSADGRYVAFVSDATSLVASDGNGVSDVFLRDRFTGTTTLVSVSDGEAEANGGSFTGSVSNDGNLVVFTSVATNLVTGDFNDTITDIYLRNVSLGTTEKISAGTSLIGATGSSRHAVISGNGQFVAFESMASDLVPGQTDINQAPDIYLRDLVNDTTIRITVPTGGPQANGGGGQAPDISSDGRWVVFTSGASDLVADGDTGQADIFRYDRTTGTIIRVSLTDTEGQANGASTVASVSDDGNIIAFVSQATNLVASDPNGATGDIFVRNVALGTTVRIPTSPSAVFPSSVSSQPSVSGDGRYVTFLQSNQIWVYDLQTGELVPQAITTSGTAATVINARPYISADGSTIVFQSTATNLVASDTNGAVLDVFVLPTSWPPLPSRPIFGDEFGGSHPDADLFHFLGPISSSSNIDLLTLTVTNVLDGSSEKLVIDGTPVELIDGNTEPTTGGLGLNVSVVVIGTTATVTITMPLAGITAAQLQDLVDGLIYQNTSATPGPLYRIVTLTGVSEVGDPTTQTLSVAATASPPNVTELVSINSNGTLANGPSLLNFSGSDLLGIGVTEYARVISNDGRYVVFASTASNLVAGDTNFGPNGAGQDIFLHDMLTGTTERVSIANDESQLNGITIGIMSISADGDRVVFQSGSEIFVRDRDAGTTTTVSISEGGTPIIIGGNSIAEISGDGTAVAFAVASFVTGFVAGDTNNAADIFLRDLDANTTERISLTDDDLQANGASSSPSISHTGQFVAFVSAASNLVTAASVGGLDTNGDLDVFVRDTVNDTTIRVSLFEGGAVDTQAVVEGVSFQPAISADGNLVVFASTAQLTSGDVDTSLDVYLRNIGTTTVNGIAPGTTILVSNSSLVSLGVNTNPTISPDGKHVAFLNTNATTLWVYNVETGVTGRAASTTNGVVVPNAAVISLSNDSMAFQSGSPLLVPNDTGGASTQDIFWAPVETLALGGTIWNDNGAGGGVSGDGIKQAGEPGINAVRLSLFSDANNDDVPDNLTQPIQITTTSATGDYQFNGLAPGNYIVRVDQDNFDASGLSTALVATPLSPVTVPEPPDADVDTDDNDDNGSRVPGQDAFSLAITLAYGTEPINDGDTIADTNFTLDFGFMANPPPVINNLGGDVASFTEDGLVPVVLDQSTAANVTDANNTNLNGGNLTASVTGGNAQDQLSIAADATILITGGNIVQFDADGGGAGSPVTIGTVAGLNTQNLVVTFTTNDATPAAVSALLQHVAYQNTNTANPPASRTVAVTVNDGLGGTSTAANVTVNITPQNDAPTVTPAILAAVNEDTTNPVGDTVANLFAGAKFTDPDNAAGTITGILVSANTADALTEGAWQYSTNGGANWFDIGTINGNSALALSAATLIRFVPVANFDDDVDALSVFGLDSTYAGGFTNGGSRVTQDAITNNGGTTAISDNPTTLDTTITSVSDAPEGTDNTVATSPAVTYTFTVADFGFTDPFDDPDDAFTGVTITTAPASGTLKNGATPLNNGDFVPLSAIIGNQLQFEPAGSDTSFTFAVMDSGIGTNVDTTANTMTILLNPPPVIADLNGDVASFTEGGATPILLDDSTGAEVGASVTDTNNANFNGGNLTVTVVGGIAEDALSIIASDNILITGGNIVQFDADGGGAGSPVNIGTVAGLGTATLVVTFNTTDATHAAVGALIQQIAYQNTNLANPATPRIVRFTVNDGSGSVSANNDVTVDLTQINDGPTAVITPASFNATEQTALDLKAQGLSVGDVDADAGMVTVTLSVTEGTLTVTAGGSGAGVAGSGTNTVTLTGTIAQINALLNTDGTSTVSYTDGSDNPSASATLTLAVDDGGATGGGALTAQDTATVNITAVNDAPAATITPPTYNATENVALSLKNNGLSVSDIDGNAGSETVTLSVTEGILNVTAGGSGAGVSGSGTGSVTITGTIAQINALLNTDATSTVDYVETDDTPSATATLTLAINDNGNTGGGNLTTQDTATVNITAVNDLPVVGNLTPSITYVIAAPPQTLSSGATVADPDSATLVSASVTLTDHQAGDELSVSGATTGGPVNGISWIYTAATGVLAFTGTSSLANYQALLDQVQYRSTSGDPSNGGANTSRDVAWTVNDGTDPSVTQHTSISVGNQAPTVDLNGGGAGNDADVSFVENGGAVGVAPASLSITDPDDANLTSATIVLTNAKPGDILAISGALPGGITSAIDTSVAGQITVTLSGNAARSAYTTAIQQVLFNSSSDNPDTTDRQITVTVNDGEDDSNSAITTVHVGIVNDGPANTVPGTQNVEANTATAIGGLLVADPDSAGAAITTTLSVGHGTLTVASAGGAAVSGSGTGTVTLIGSVAAINTTLLAANNIVYKGALDFFGTDTLTVTTNDGGNTGTGGPLADLDNVTINLNTLINGTSGDDSYNALPGQEMINGGGGIDTITFGFRLVDATVTYTGNRVIIDGPTGSHTVLTGFEVFNFTDGTVNNNDGNWLVDDLFYYSQYHDVWNAHLDADANYNDVGWHQNRDPNAFFSTVVYLSEYPDVKASGVNPLVHFDTAGWLEHRIPSITFDPNKYLAANPDVAAAHVDPLVHFLAFGAGEGRQPIAPTEIIAPSGFDYVYYLQNNPDVAAARVDPLLHYNLFGWHEGRNPNALFDVNGYLTTYTDVAAANINPLDHYNIFGWHEGRDPSLNFDTTSYLAAYSDVAAANVNPLNHFLIFGIHEGRSPFADGLWG